MRIRTRTVAIAGALLLASAGLAWALWPAPPPPPPAPPGDDPTREETEDFMRTIGYVQ